MTVLEGLSDEKTSVVQKPGGVRALMLRDSMDCMIVYKEV